MGILVQVFLFLRRGNPYESPLKQVTVVGPLVTKMFVSINHSQLIVLLAASIRSAVFFLLVVSPTFILATVSYTRINPCNPGYR